MGRYRVFYIYAILLIPVGLGLIWGDFLTVETYLSLAQAQAIGSGRLAALPNTIDPAQFLISSPLYVLWLALLSYLEVPIVPAARILSILGWMLSGVLIFKTLEAWGMRYIRWFWPLAILFSPVVTWGLGSEAAVVLAVSWLAIWLGTQEEWEVQSAVFILLLGLYLSPLSLTLIALLLLHRREKGPLINKVSLFLLILAAAWQFYYFWQREGWLLNHNQFLRGLPQRTDLYWFVILLIPFIFLPLFDTKRRHAVWQRLGKIGRLNNLLALFLAPPFLLLAWLAMALFDGSVTAQAISFSSLMLYLGIILETRLNWLLSSGWINAQRRAAPYAFAAFFMVPILAANFTVLWLDYAQRPLAKRMLEQEAARWLRENTSPQTPIASTPFVGLTAERPLFVYSRNPQTEAELATFFAQMTRQPPAYILTDRTAVWLTNVGWFQDNYRSIKRLGSPYEPTSPLSIWEYNPNPAQFSETRPLDITLENGAHLIGYQQWPELIEPGEAVYLILHWQATNPIELAFQTLAWVADPIDGETQAQRDLPTPRSLPPNWLMPDQIITESFVLTTTQRISPGGYPLKIAFRQQNTLEVMAFYEGGDTNPLDQRLLNYVTVPAGGVNIDEGSQLLNVRFGDHIILKSSSLPAAITAKANDTLHFDMVWESQQRPPEDWVVFLHLLDKEGNLVATGDGPPSNGRFPTGSWAAQMAVVDKRTLPLPSELAAGRYALTIGLYHPETGFRLTAFDAQGNALTNDAFPLATITVGP